MLEEFFIGFIFALLVLRVCCRESEKVWDLVNKFKNKKFLNDFFFKNLLWFIEDWFYGWEYKLKWNIMYLFIKIRKLVLSGKKIRIYSMVSFM